MFKFLGFFVGEIYFVCYACYEQLIVGLEAQNEVIIHAFMSHGEWHNKLQREVEEVLGSCNYIGYVRDAKNESGGCFNHHVLRHTVVITSKWACHSARPCLRMHTPGSLVQSRCRPR
jgi:hypothetical protein